MRFTDVFVRRPVLAIVVNLVILIAGLWSIRSLSVRQYPRSDIAVVRVKAGVDQGINLLIGLAAIAQELGGDRAMFAVSGRRKHVEDNFLVLQRILPNGQLCFTSFGVVRQAVSR